MKRRFLQFVHFSILLLKNTYRLRIDWSLMQRLFFIWILRALSANCKRMRRTCSLGMNQAHFQCWRWKEMSERRPYIVWKLVQRALNKRRTGSPGEKATWIRDSFFLPPTFVSDSSLQLAMCWLHDEENIVACFWATDLPARQLVLVGYIGCCRPWWRKLECKNFVKITNLRHINIKLSFWISVCSIARKK